MARGGNVRVSITGDASGLKKATGKAESDLAQMQAHAKKHFGEMSKHALGYGAALIGGAGVVGGLEAVAEASISAEKSQAKLQTQLKAVGISYSDHSKEIDNVVAKTSAYSGFLDKDLNGALANIVRSTGDLGKSLGLLGLASDIARSKNIGVADAGQLIGKIYAGNTRVLKSLGIQLDPVTKAQDRLKDSTKHASDEQKRAAAAEDKRATAQKAIALLQTKLSGQAEAYGKTTAGSLDRMKASVDNLEVKLGNALAPTIKIVADKLSKFVGEMETGKGAGGRFADKMKDVADRVGDVAGVAKDVVKWLGKHPALLKAVGAAWVAYKTVALTNIALTKLAMLGLFGPAVRAKMVTQAAETGAASGRALGSAGSLAAWKSGGKLMGAAALAGVIYYLQEHQGDSRPFWDRILNPVGPGVGSKSKIPTYKPPKGAPPYKPGPGPLKIVPPESYQNPKSPGHGVIRPHASNFVPLPGTDFSSGSEPELARRLKALSDYLGVDFTGISGARSPQHSVAVGGTANDPHTRGQAVDVGGGNIQTVPESVLNRFGLTRPMQSWHGKDERNHIQLKGTPSGGRGGGGTEKITWRDCVLTWYDPALGGTNSGDGSKDANAPTASGELYNPAAFTCAAPQGYAFGTILAFRYNGRTVACKVNDRGGAITGHHFDLSRAAAAALGILGAGTVNAKFANPGKSKSIRKAKTPFDSLGNLTGYIDLEQQAGILTEQQAAQQTIAAVNQALPNLHGSNRLRALGTRRTAQQTLRDARKQKAANKAAAAADYAQRKAGFTDNTLNNPWLTAYLNHQDYLVATGQLDQASADANKTQALQGAIGSGKLSEADVVSATGMIQNLVPTAPGDTAVGDEGVRLSRIDAQVRAGDITEAQGRDAKIASIDDALSNWVLSDDARLELRGERADLVKENTDATNTATDAMKAQTDAMNALKDEVKKQNDYAASVSAVSLGAAWKAMADMISGQIGGYAGAGGRALTAGAGNVVRY